MKITQNAFGDYFVYKNGVFKGYTLKGLGMYKVFNKNGRLGFILKRNNEYISYDNMGNPIDSGDFETLFLGFFK